MLGPTFRIIDSPALPMAPTPEQDVIRIVRHGLADVLEWLGEDVGPKPGEKTHSIVSGSNVYVSKALFDRLCQGEGGFGSLQSEASLTPAR